jgi:hypothetical protein
MKSMLGRGLDSCGSGYGLMAGIYEYGIKSSGSVKGGTQQVSVAVIYYTCIRDAFGSSRGRETGILSTQRQLLQRHMNKCNAKNAWDLIVWHLSIVFCKYS